MKAEAQKVYAAFLIEREAKEVNEEKDNLPAAERDPAFLAEEREMEWYFEFPNSTDKCGPYKTFGEAMVDSAFGKWKLFWRFKAIPAGRWNLQGTLASVPPQAEKDVCGAPQGEGE